MKMIIMTGAESSLGSEISKRSKQEIYNISGETIRGGKKSIDKAIEKCAKENGEVSGVINNFGINHLSWIGQTEETDEEIIIVNSIAPYWVVNKMVEIGICPTGGKIINIASAAYRTPMRCTSLYCASKAALVQMTKVMSRELSPKGWIANCISPGFMPETKMAKLTKMQILELRGWTEEEAKNYENSLIPMERPTSTKEVAEAVWKLWEMPDYVNGAVIDVMGGS
jgi:3-oxoacyl-[acyl-carrier protein] reductase